MGPYAIGTLIIDVTSPLSFLCFTVILLKRVPKPIIVFLRIS
jgi:hypothetical protein